MVKEVEILKIGSVMSKFSGKKTIMIVDKGGDIFDYYISILRKNCENDYGFLKAAKSIVGDPQVFKSSFLGRKPSVLKGTSDGDPILGMSYTINSGSWKTSKVEKIIDDCIIITSNSVYAIHNLSDIRNKKIEGLGI
jgi:hypothetical protein